MPEALDIARLPLDVLTAPDIQAAADRVVRHSLQATGARWAEVVAARPDGRLEVLASSDPPTTRTLLRCLEEAGEGPAVPGRHGDAGTVVIDDLATDGKWPAFGRLATQRTPVRSAVLQYLVVGDRYAAVLPVFDDAPGFFTPERVRRVRILGELFGGLLAGHAAYAEAGHLSTALRTNRDIATALGILMAGYDLDREQAFAALRRVSQTTQRKVAEVANEVITTGALPLPAQG